MKLSAIKKAVKSYQDYLESGERFDHRYLFEIPYQFNAALVKEDSILPAIVKGLKSDHTQRLWKREKYEPKKMILQLGKEFPDYFEEAVKDLYNKDKLLENRIDRFKFYCDELLNMYKQEHSHKNINHHYIDESFISCLLMGYDPDEYAYYDWGLFQETAHLVKAKPLPNVNDYPRYLNFVKVFYTYISENHTILNLHQKRDTGLAKPANLAVECMAVANGYDLLGH